MPNLITRSLGALMRKAMAFSGYGGFGGSYAGMPILGLPGTSYNYARAAGDLWKNSAVAIGLGWIAGNFPEPTLVVERRVGGKWTAEDGHPLTALMEAPNKFYTADDLWAATMGSFWTNGNAYWIKVRDDADRVVEVWYVPHWLMRPDWDGSEFVTRYLYFVNGKPVIYEPRDVVHFRNDMDPESMGRLGTCPLAYQLREVATDNEGSSYSASLLRNFGVPAVSITPIPVKTPGGEVVPKIDKAASDTIKENWRARFTGEGRADPFVPTHPMAVEKIGFSPEELAIDRMLNRPEMRIIASLRLNCQVVGLPAGEGVKTYSNWEEARRGAYQDNIKPSQRKCGRTLKAQLLPDFETMDGAAGANIRVGWDYSEVLPEDANELSLRTVNEKKAGIWTINEARAKLGGDPTADGDVREPIPPATAPTPGDGTDPSAENAPKKPAKAFREEYRTRTSERRREYERAA